MSGGGTNTVSTSVPSEFLPYYEYAMGQGAGLQQAGGPQYYPGQTVAPLNPLQEGGLSQVAALGAQPNNPANSAANASEFLTSGALLNPSSNPYLQGTYQQAADSVQNQLSSEFAGSGRNIAGSAPVQSDELNNLATQLYGGAYQQGITAMNTASAYAPGVENAQYTPSAQLLSAGSGLQGQTQNLMNANQNEWNYNQKLPYNTLSWYSSLLGQNGSPFSQQNQSSSGNPWATAAGAASLGAGLYSSGALAGIAGLFGGSGATMAGGSEIADVAAAAALA